MLLFLVAYVSPPRPGTVFGCDTCRSVRLSVCPFPKMARFTSGKTKMFRSNPSTALLILFVVEWSKVKGQVQGHDNRENGKIVSWS